METIAYIILFAFLVGAAIVGVLYEIRQMKAAIAKERKQIELYEALLRKLEEC